MSPNTFLVQHRRRARRGDVPDGPESFADVRDTPYWSLWRWPQYPWSLIDDGVKILLLESWSSGSRVTWLVEAHDILRVRAESREEAIEAIARWSGSEPGAVARSTYLQASTVDAGVVLGWRARPMVWIGQPRPVDLRLDRHGWSVLRGEDLAAWGLEVV